MQIPRSVCRECGWLLLTNDGVLTTFIHLTSFDPGRKAGVPCFLDMLQRIDHVNLVVADMRAMVDFYFRDPGNLLELGPYE